MTIDELERFIFDELFAGKARGSAVRAAIEAHAAEKVRAAVEAAVLECSAVKRLAEADGDAEVALGALRCMERIRARGAK